MKFESDVFHTYRYCFGPYFSRFFITSKLESASLLLMQNEDDEEPDPQKFLGLRGLDNLQQVDTEIEQNLRLLNKYNDSTDVGQGNALVITKLQKRVRFLKQLKRQYAGYQKVRMCSMIPYSLECVHVLLISYCADREV